MLETLSEDVVATPLELYSRWEKQLWQVDSLHPSQDRDGWHSLPEYTREELRVGIEGFFLGESAVAQTLAPLVQAAPSEDDQAFLATQLLDEARHSLFFRSYLTTVEGSSLPRWSEAPDSLAALLDQALRQATDRVREDPADREAWYRSLVIYHLLVEGVLAVSAMRSLIAGARARPELAVLQQGIANVARDESRHISYGVHALGVGAAEGYGDAVLDALRQFTPIAVRALIGPQRRLPALFSAEIRDTVATELSRLWGLAEAALLSRTQRILMNAKDTAVVRQAWQRSVDLALAEYQDLHQAAHPVPRETVAS